MARADYPAAFLRQAREMGSRGVVAAVSFAVRFSPETGPFAVVLFSLCRCSLGFATAAAVVVVVDPSGPSAADLSVVAAGPGFVDSAAFAADFACSVCSFAVALGKGRVAAVPFCFLTHRSFF